MADRITKGDVRKVQDLVLEHLSWTRASVGGCGDYELVTSDPATMRTYRILIAGWSFGKTWQRAFTASLLSGAPTYGHAGKTQKHFSPVPMGERYEGRGWHSRMAADIIEKLRELSEHDTSTEGGVRC
jgi:hypothetical protein